jgi:hypothetical protein
MMAAPTGLSHLSVTRSLPRLNPAAKLGTLTLMRCGLASFLALHLAALPATNLQAQILVDPSLVYETGIEIAATALANALVASRDAAWTQGTEPMPRHIRQALLGWYPAELLDSIEFRVGVAEEATVQSLSMRYSDATAVTAIDTIIFADARDARDNVALWGHEVKHVEQFRVWGLMEFARRYVRDHAAVEAEAYAIGAEIKAFHVGD